MFFFSSTFFLGFCRYESTIFLLLYVAYCVMMYYNPMLERWANTLPIPLPDAARRMPGGGEQASLMPYKNLDEEQQQHQTTGKLYTEEKSPGKISFVG